MVRLSNKKLKKMEHFYHTLPGENWFNYEEFYKFIITQLPNDSKMIEIGSWLGRSITYFVVESKIQNKNIDCFCVDIWEPYAEINNHSIFQDDGAYKTFISNIKRVSESITPIRGKSLDICNNFEDNYFDLLLNLIFFCIDIKKTFTCITLYLSDINFQIFKNSFNTIILALKLNIPLKLLILKNNQKI